MFVGFAREQFRTRFSNAAAVEVWWKHLFRVVASQETKRDAVQKRAWRTSMQYPTSRLLGSQRDSTFPLILLSGVGLDLNCPTRL